MLKRISLVNLFFIVGCLAITSSVFAGLIDYARLERIRERKRAAAAAAEKQTPSNEDQDSIAEWMIVDPKVRNAVEDSYDVNRDGKLQNVEVKIYLRSVIAQVKEKGGMTLNSDILKEYDKNKDGLISRIEVEAIERDAQ